METKSIAYFDEYSEVVNGTKNSSMGNIRNYKFNDNRMRRAVKSLAPLPTAYMIDVTKTYIYFLFNFFHHSPF